MKKDKANLFITYSEEINKAYESAVRDALVKHKKDGNSIVVSRNGEIVTLKPDEIEVNWWPASNTYAKPSHFRGCCIDCGRNMIWTDEETEEIIQEEDFDISAIYVLRKGKSDLNSPRTDEAIRIAMTEARRKHKEAGIPMVVSWNGEIVYVQPDEIESD